MAASLTEYLLAAKVGDNGDWDYSAGEDWTRQVEEIRAVHFHTAELSAEQQAFLTQLPELRAIAFCDDFEHTADSLRRIGELAEQRQVTDVEFEEARHLPWLEHFPATTVLRLGSVHRLEPEQLDALVHVPALEVLVLSGKDLRPAHLERLRGLRALRVLDLSLNPEVDDVSALAELGELRELRLGDTRVTDLGPLAGLTKLELLELGQTPVAKLTPLAGLTALRELDLTTCVDLGAEEVKHVLGAPLRVLKLSGCWLGPEGAELFRGRSFDTLEVLGTGIPGAQLLELGVDPLRTCPSGAEVAGKRDAAGAWDFVEINEWEGDLGAVRAFAYTNGWCDEPGTLGFLSFVPQLEALNLESTSDIPLGDLAAICRLGQLRELDLGEADFAMPEGEDDELNDPLLVQVVEGLPQLERLRIGGAACSAAGLARLAELPQLRELGLKGVRAAGEALPSLSALPLEVLDLSSGALSDAGPSALGGFPALTRLNLSRNTLTVEDLEALSSSTELTELDLSFTQLKDVSPLRSLSKLRALKLSRNLLDDRVAPVLASLTELEELALDETQVGDTTVWALAGLGKLRRLELGMSQVTDAAVPQLSGLGLERLGLRGVWLEDAQREALSAAGVEDLTLSELGEEDGTDLGTFAGVLTRPFTGKLPDPTRGVAWRVSSSTYEPEFPLETILARLLADPRAGEVEALVLGAWESAGETPCEKALAGLIAAKDRLSSLRALSIGDMDGEECEISWIHLTDLSGVIAAFPNLEVLKIRGSEGLRLPRPLALPRLRGLTIECGGLPGHVLEAVATASLPELEHLELYLGVEDYGWSGSLDTLNPILSGKAFPTLRYLGIKDSEAQDEIARRVATAPVLAQLEVLDLSLGVLTDVGAQALLANEAALVRLRRLDLRHNFLSPEVAEKLESLAIEVDVGDRQDDDYRYVAVSE